MMVILYTQAIFLVFCFVAGFLIAIPVGINQSKNDGSCLLYANIVKSGHTVKSLASKGGNFRPGSSLSCNFCIFSGSISLFMAFVLLFGTIYVILRKTCGNSSVLSSVMKFRKNDESSSKPLIGAWIHFCGSLVMSLITFVTACLISSGFHEFCENGLKRIHKKLESCDVLESSVGTFYQDLSIAQLSAWLGALCWIVLAIIGRINVRNLKPKRSRTQTFENDYHQIESPVHL